MKIIKISICILLALIICIPTGIYVLAYDGSYNSNVSSLQFVTLVENQGDKSECLAYALLSTAGSYCIKNNILPADKANFSEKKLIKNIGDSTNFGEVIYSATKYNLGSDCYITGIEDLTDRGELYIKHKIKENGAVMAAISLPSSGMKDSDYYSVEKASFNYNNTEQSGSANHAFSIVGWDDTFSKDNFLVKPEKSGAWLCKNSYGTEYGKNGYFYLPYSYEFLYAAAVEISRFPDVIDVRDGSSSVLWLGYISAVGFRSGESSDNAKVLIKSDTNETEFTKSVVDGYNLICFDKPIKAKSLRVFINGAEISPSSVNCMVVWSESKSVSVTYPSSEGDWIENVETMDISIHPTDDEKPGRASAQTNKNGSIIYHNKYHNFVDNCWYISPCDGYMFTDNTIVESFRLEGYFGENIAAGNITISQLVENSDGSIRFEDGCLIIYSYDKGSNYIDGIDIHTDENGKVESVDYYSKGQIINFKAKYNLFADEGNAVSIENPGKEINNVTGLDYYYIVIDTGTYILIDDISISINGSPVNTESRISESGSKIMVKIDIPSIEETIIGTIFSLFRALMKPLLALLG